MKIEEFVFRKDNGSIRILTGTRDLVGFEKTFPLEWKGEFNPTGKKPSEGTITLIDLAKMAWRSIKPETIISSREVSEKFSHKLKKNFLRRDKIPYHILMIMNGAKTMSRNDVEVMVEGIMFHEDRELTFRSGHIRAFSRAFRLLKNNGYIERNEKRKGECYSMTIKGQNLLYSRVK